MEALQNENKQLQKENKQLKDAKALLEEANKECELENAKLTQENKALIAGNAQLNALVDSIQRKAATPTAKPRQPQTQNAGQNNNSQFLNTLNLNGSPVGVGALLKARNKDNAKTSNGREKHLT